MENEKIKAQQWREREERKNIHASGNGKKRLLFFS